MSQEHKEPIFGETGIFEDINLENSAEPGSHAPWGLLEEPEHSKAGPLNEIKVVFLGDGEAGKSHIIARLMNDGGEPAGYWDAATPGVCIRNIIFDLDGRQVKVHLWDFGGMEIMHSMHRFFMTDRTMYVVVLNARDDTQSDRARYWLHTIHSFAPHAPVLLVLNKIDQNLRAYVDEMTLRGRYDGLTQIVRLSALRFTQEEFNRSFTDVLKEEINRTGYLDVQWPESWRRLKDKLESMESHYITGGEYEALCDACQVDGNRQELLRWFNDLGVSFSFCDRDDYTLRDHIILRPDWIINALYVILFNECEDAQNGRIPHRSIHKLLRKAGEDYAVRCIMPGVRYSSADIQYVLNIMRKFQLSFRHGEEFEFIPALCQQNSTVDIHYYERDSEVLEFNMEFDYLPNNLLHRLMVERHDELDVDNVWRSGAVFRLPGTGLSAVVSIDDNTLHLFIRHTDSMHRPNTYLSMLKAHVNQICEEMGLQKPRLQLVYKLDGMRDAFDYEMLNAMRETGQTHIYSLVWRRMIPIADILNQSAPVNMENERALLEAIRQSCHVFYPKELNRESREWLRIRRLRDNLKLLGYDIRDQLEKAGYMDLIVADGMGEPWAGIEAINIHQGQRTMSTWDMYLDKLLDAYNPTRMSLFFLISYVECEKEEYPRLWNRYRDHMRRYSPGRSELLVGSYEEIEDNGQGNPYQNIFRCRYFANGTDVTVYHCFVRTEPVQREEMPEITGEALESEAERVTIATDAGGQEPEERKFISVKTDDVAQTQSEQPQDPRKPPLQWLGQLIRNIQKLFISADAKQRKQDSRQVLKECRVVFLGDSEAGKSLIMSRLENPKLDPAKFHGNTTNGINIVNRIETINGQRVRVRYWDFGGQEILHSMHRMFLSDKTLYVIVLNTRNDNQDAQANFWLRYVDAYASGAPALLVMNKIDQNKRASLNLPVLCRQVRPKLTKEDVLKISAVEKNPEVFRVEFKEKLIAFIERNAGCIHSFTPEETEVRDAVEQKQEKIFDMNDFLTTCRQKGITDQVKQIDLSNRFNDAGIMISFGDTTPMFLNPKWITSSIYKVLEHGNKIADNGVVSYVQLGEVCARNPEKWRGYDDADLLLRIMRDYELSFKCETKTQGERLSLTQDFIPMLCRREEPGRIAELIREDDPVEMRMVFEYLPGGVLYKVMADHRKKLDSGNIWLTGAKIDYADDNYAIVRQESNTMAIYVHNSDKLNAVKQLLALKEEIEKSAKYAKFHAKLNEIKISYSIADEKEYFDYQQVENSKQCGIRYMASTRKEHPLDADKLPKADVRDILDQDAGSREREEKELLQLILLGCMDVQKDKVFWTVNENARNRQIARAIRGPFLPKDQTESGTTETGKSEGELDIEILNTKNIPIAILEALNTTSIQTKNWKAHLDKLVKHYNPNGLAYLILVSYVQCPPQKFLEKFRDTVDSWKTVAPKDFEGCLESVEAYPLEDCPELIRITRTVYFRNDFRVSLFHFLVHIEEAEETTASDTQTQQ